MELILVRHPQVQAEPGTCYGQLDVPLREPVTPDPADIARVLGALSERPVVRVLSSPLQRALRLAEALATHFGSPLQTDPRWMELHFGQWEGLPWQRVPRAESDAWADDVEHRAPPGGETLAALRQRVHAAMDAAANACPPTGRVLVVAHAGPMRVAAARARGLSQAEQWDLSLPFGGWLRLHATPVGHDWQWQDRPGSSAA